MDDTWITWAAHGHAEILSDLAFASLSRRAAIVRFTWQRRIHMATITATKKFKEFEGNLWNFEEFQGILRNNKKRNPQFSESLDGRYLPRSV